MILSDAISQSLSYSWYALIGYPLVLVVNVIMIIVMFKSVCLSNRRPGISLFLDLRHFSIDFNGHNQTIGSKTRHTITCADIRSKMGRHPACMLFCIIVFNAIMKKRISFH
ncbi:hypothetical protein ACEQPO_10310 [Bacillus sp. SL00103]